MYLYVGNGTYVPLSVAHLLGKAQEATHGIGAGGQHKDQRSGVQHVLIESGQSHGRTLHKLRSQVTGDKVDCCKNHLRKKVVTCDFILSYIKAYLLFAAK